MSLNIQDLSITLGDCTLYDVNCEIQTGEYFVLLGESGVGKTVLLETLAGFIVADMGTIMVDEVDITSLPIQRRPFGIIYQDCALFPHLSVQRNILWGLRQMKIHASERQQRLKEAAELTGVEELLERSPLTLSGGETQRVALARVLVRRPEFLLLDEPLSSLDPAARIRLRALLRHLHRRGTTILHVTHSWEDAISLAERIAIMENGTIVQIGTAEEVFTRPRSEFVARFTGLRNIFQGDLQDSDRDTALFKTGPVEFTLLSNGNSGRGRFLLGSDEVLLSTEEPATSARNCFSGQITDLEPVQSGVEVEVDIGVAVFSRVTRASLDNLKLTTGGQVWISFKAGAGRFLVD
jgi:molybdate/tungstate transport system ATP-binding protein